MTSDLQKYGNLEVMPGGELACTNILEGQKPYFVA